MLNRQQKADLPYEYGEFWSARQRQAHRIHEISYRACFKPQLPRYFIEHYSKAGDIVYDPFMGRGTTPVEAALADRVPYGNDLSALSCALTEPRLNTPPLAAVHERLDELSWDDFKTCDNRELLTFYHPRTLAQLEGLRNYLQHTALDPVDKWIRMVALNRLTGHSPGFFSVYTMPPNQAVSLERQQLINRKRNQQPPYRNVPELIAKKSRTLLSQNSLSTENYLLLNCPADNTPQLSAGEVTLTVTSPPFLDIVDYRSDNWLRNWFLGIEPRRPLSQHRDIAAWQAFIASTLAELARITRTGGHIAFEVGEVRRAKIELEHYVIAAAAGLPLKVRKVMINTQQFTKTANCWGVANNQLGTNTNRIVLFEKT